MDRLKLLFGQEECRQFLERRGFVGGKPGQDGMLFEDFPPKLGVKRPLGQEATAAPVSEESEQSATPPKRFQRDRPVVALVRRTAAGPQWPVDGQP